MVNTANIIMLFLMQRNPLKFNILKKTLLGVNIFSQFYFVFFYAFVMLKVNTFFFVLRC